MIFGIGTGMVFTLDNGKSQSATPACSLNQLQGIPVTMARAIFNVDANRCHQRQNKIIT